MKDLRKILGITGLRVGSSGLPILVTFLIAMLFSPAEFGTISFIWSLAVILAVFLDFGSSLQIRKLIPRLVRQRSLWRRYAFSISLGVVARLVFLICLVVLYFQVSSSEQFRLETWFAVFLALGFALESLTVEIFRGRGQYLLAEYCNGGFRYSVYIPCLGVAALFAVSVEGLLTLFSVFLVSLAAVLFVISARPLAHSVLRHGTAYSGKTLRSFRERGRFFIVNLIIMLSQQLPVVAAALLSGGEAAAFVKISVLFGVVMQILISSNTIYFAALIARVQRDNHSAVQALILKSARIGLLILPMGLAWAILIPIMIKAFFDAPYEASILGAQIVVVAYTFSCIFGAYSQMILLRGRESVVIIGVAGGLVLQLVIILLFNQALGLTVYSVALAVGFLVSLLIQVVAGWMATGITPGPIRHCCRTHA